MSMCFVRLLSPVLDEADFPAVLSVCRMMLVVFVSCASCRTDLMYSPSDVPLPIAYSSASPELCAIVCCVFEYAVIVVPLICATMPDVDLRVS